VRQPIEVAARQPIAAVAPPVQSDAVTQVEPRDAREDTAAPDETMATRTAWPTDGAGPISNVDLVPNLPANDAKSYRTRGIFEYRNGDLKRALADFDRAIRHDPNYADAYVDRGIVLFRMSQFDRAFADLTKAKRIASANRTKSATATPVPAPAPPKFSPVRVRNALNVAASDRYLDPGIQSDRSLDLSIHSMPFERRR
jgi:tetratricopeptide (TPR) repeat protein